MIARVWKGLAKPGKLGDYAEHLRVNIEPELARLVGFRGLYLLHRQAAQGDEVVVTTLWDSLEDIATFAGDDLERAVVAPEAQPLFLSYDERVKHFVVGMKTDC